MCHVYTREHVQFTDRTNPMDKHVNVLSDTYGIAAAPITPQMFASAGKEHMEKYGQGKTCTFTALGVLCYFALLFVRSCLLLSSFCISH